MKKIFYSFIVLLFSVMNAQTFRATLFSWTEGKKNPFESRIKSRFVVTFRQNLNTETLQQFLQVLGSDQIRAVFNTETERNYLKFSTTLTKYEILDRIIKVNKHFNPNFKTAQEIEQEKKNRNVRKV